MERLTFADHPAGITTAVDEEADRLAAAMDTYATEIAAAIEGWLAGEEAIA